MRTQRQGLSRRGFVGFLSTLGAGAFSLAACGKAGAPTAAAAGGGMAGPQMAGMAAATPTASGAMTADEMDKMHEAGVKAFPAKTAGVGGQPLAPRMEGEFKVFDLVAKRV